MIAKLFTVLLIWICGCRLLHTYRELIIDCSVTCQDITLATEQHLIGYVFACAFQYFPVLRSTGREGVPALSSDDALPNTSKKSQTNS